MRRTPWLWIGAAILGVWGGAVPALADVESELKAEIGNFYALTRSGFVSECTDHYTDNQVTGGRITGSDGVRFDAGELVQIDSVKVGSFAGLAVNLTLVEPYRLGWKDGPYEVFEQRRCRAQLHFDVPRDVRKDRVRARAAIEAALALFDHEGAAKKDPAWNRRKVEAYPPNWEATKREWETWRRSQQNRRVREKSETVLEQADRVLAYMPNDEKYLASFGAGARARGSESWSSCDVMLDASFYVSGSGADTRGWSDGQLVAWATQLARALQECYIEAE
jgi:hypothetical protein